MTPLHIRGICIKV